MEKKYTEIINELKKFLIEHPYIQNRFIDAQFVSDGADIELSILADTWDCNKVIVDRIHNCLKFYALNNKVTLPKFRIFFIKNNQIEDRYLF
jgi:hypothetical protein